MSEPSRERFPSIPDLEILERLGSGGVGSVYLARHAGLDRLVAVKILRRELARNRLYVARLEREARLSARLDHPNIVKGLDHGDVDGVPYFVMEFVDGKSLKTVLRERGRLEEDEVLEFGLQVARALDHAYRLGVVHRDIKPGNLLLAKDGTLKLADLGLARRPDDSSVTKEGTTLGTPHYVSPEQARDPVTADTRSDLYSLGATLFHVATGRPPFDAETVGGVLSQVLDASSVAQVPADVPLSRNLELCLLRLLAKDPARRYQTPDEVIRDLERVRRHERPSVSVFDVNPRARLRLRVGLASGAGLVVVATLVLLAGAGLGLFGSNAPSPAARAAAEELGRLETDADGSPAALADRWARVDALLASGAFEDAGRLRATALQTTIGEAISAAFDGLEREIDRDLAAGIAERRLDEAWTQLETEFPRRVREAFDRRAELLPGPFAIRFERYLDTKRRDLRQEVAAAEAAILAMLPAFLEEESSRVQQHVEEGRFADALVRLADAPSRLMTPQGDAPRRLPDISRDSVAERIRGELASIRSRVLQEAAERGRRITARLQAEFELLRRGVTEGTRSATASEFADEAETVFREMGYVRQQWPLEVVPDPGGLAKDLHDSLASLDRKAEEQRTLREFEVLEARTWARMRERQYVTASQVWRSERERPELAAVRARLDRRIGYADALAGLRARAGRELARRVGTRVNLSLRSGAIASGRLVSTESLADDWLGTLADGAIPEVRFSALALGEIETLVAAESGPRARLELGLLWMAEGQLDRAQARFAAARLDPEASASEAELAAFALSDVSALRLLSQGSGSERERLYRATLDRARELTRIGEMEQARAEYERVRTEAVGFDVGDPRVADLDREIEEFEVLWRAHQRRRALAGAFPGARASELPDGRLRLDYDLAAGPGPSGLEVPKGWRRTAAGIQCEGAALEDASRLGRAPALRFPLPAMGRGPVRFTARSSLPYESDPVSLLVHGLTAFGRTGAIHRASGGGPWSAQLISGGAEVLDLAPWPRHWEPGFRRSSGFLRGGTHDLSLDVSEDGRSAVLRVDGAAVASLDAAVAGDACELRCTGAILLRSLSVEGVALPR